MLGADALVVSVKEACSICGNRELHTVIDLGESPIANKFLSSAESTFNTFPLVLQHCKNCKNFQLQTCLSESLLYSDDYAYFTPVSRSLAAHYENVEEAFRSRGYLGDQSNILEIGSNNGEFLKPYASKGYSVLGVDPAKDATVIAACKGVPSICDFFSEALAKCIRDRFGRVDIVVARHMFAHNSDPRRLISGVAEVLSDTGVFYIENAYAIDTLINGEFDQVYHEHMYYYSALSLNNLLNSTGFELIDIIFSDIHGGSAGFFAARSGARMRSIDLCRCFEKEREVFSSDPDFYEFRSRVSNTVGQLKRLVDECIDKGVPIGVYSVPNKFFTLLSFCKIDPSYFSIFIDTSSNKINKFFPGARVPVVGEEEAADSECGHFVVGAWNYKEDIISRAASIFRPGTRLIFPLPYFHVHVV